MEKENVQYGIVGDIPIKEIKRKKKKKKKNDEAPLAIKILVWFMFIAMLSSFLIPLAVYFYNVISAS